MFKPKKLLFFFSTFILLIFNSFIFAEEAVTITTYYPSPYGVYNSLQTDKLGVGDNSGDGKLNSADVPTTTGDAWIKGKVGIGTVAPGERLSVGSNTFQVNSSGNLVKVNNVAYSWPSSQGGASTVLTNDGSGNLSWGAGGGGITGTLTFAVPCNQVGTLSIDVANGIITGYTTGYGECGDGGDDSGGGL